jgi:hypothetical protein
MDSQLLVETICMSDGIISLEAVLAKSTPKQIAMNTV